MGDDGYVEWMRLTDHGKKKVSEAELEKLGITRVEEVFEATTEAEQVEAKRLYESYQEQNGFTVDLTGLKEFLED